MLGKKRPVLYCLLWCNDLLVPMWI